MSNPSDHLTPKIRLKALGYIELVDSGGRSIATLMRRPKQVAFVCVAALGHRGIRSADRLMAMFWPESASARARHSLTQMLYRIKQELGQEVLERRGDQVVVDGERLWCDVTAFEEAAADGRHREAADLYRGDLLEGLYLADCPDFERWVEQQRGTLRRIAAASVWAYAEQLAEAGELTDASGVARRAAALTPGEEATIQRLLGFLDGIGDRAHAVKAFEEFEAFVQSEYEMAPSPETVALVEAIRARDQANVVHRARPPRVGTQAGRHPGEEDRPRASGDMPHLTETSPPDPPLSGSARPRRWFAVAVGGAIAAIAWLAFTTTLTTPDPRRIAVLESRDPLTRFGVAPGSGVSALVTTASRQLTADLARVRELTVIPQSFVGDIELGELDVALGVGAIVLLDGWEDAGQARTVVQIVDPTTDGIVALRSFPDTGSTVAIARFVRQRLGDLGRARQLGAELPDAGVMDLIAEADWLAARGQRHGSQGRSTIAWSFLLEADSVLALAEGRAPTWVEPTLRRGWLAHQRMLFLTLADPVEGQEAGRSGLHDMAMTLLGEAEGHADRGLVKDPESPFAFELRGAARFTRYRINNEQDDALGIAAEADLSIAVETLPSLQGAWTRLGSLRQVQGDVGGALIAIRRSLEADPFLEYDLTTRRILLRTAAWAGDRETAERACVEGRADFPEDRSFVECRLFLMSWFAELADSEETGTELNNLATYGPRNLQLLYAAAALAHAGFPDSSRAVLDYYRELPAGSDSLVSAVSELRVLGILGDYRTAADRAALLFARHPGVLRSAARDPRLRGLRGAADYEALLDSLGIS